MRFLKNQNAILSSYVLVWNEKTSIVHLQPQEGILFHIRYFPYDPSSQKRNIYIPFEVTFIQYYMVFGVTVKGLVWQDLCQGGLSQHYLR